MSAGDETPTRHPQTAKACELQPGDRIVVLIGPRHAQQSKERVVAGVEALPYGNLQVFLNVTDGYSTSIVAASDFAFEVMPRRLVVTVADVSVEQLMALTATADSLGLSLEYRDAEGEA